MASVTFPVGLGGDGSTVTDDNNASTGLGNNGHRTRFVPALAQVVVMAQSAVTAATNAGNSATNAATSATNASNSAAAAAASATSFSGTSSTSRTIATGSLSFTTQTGKNWTAGQFLIISSTTSPTNYITGQVTSYNSGTGALVFDSQLTSGSGTFASWNIGMTGQLGPVGPTGATIRNGIGNPTSGVGVNGDYYIDKVSPYKFWGPKASGAWPGSPLFQIAMNDPVIGEIVHSISPRSNYLQCRGQKFDKTSYAALAVKVGNTPDLGPAATNFTNIATFAGTNVLCGACEDPSRKFGYVAFKNAAFNSSGDTEIRRYIQGTSYATQSNILSTSTDSVVAIASNGSYLVALCRNAAGTAYYLRYNTINAAGNTTGTWTNVTPAGLTVAPNGFGVCNGLFWLSYNIGGVATSPRLAFGANPASLSVVTPSVNNDTGTTSLMFFDGTSYIWWTGSNIIAQSNDNMNNWFNTGLSVGASGTSNAFVGAGTQNTYMPSYSADGSKCVFFNSGFTGGFARVSNFGRSSQNVGYPDNDAVNGNGYACFVGNECFVGFSISTNYYISRVDFGQATLYGNKFSTGLAAATRGLFNIGVGIVAADSANNYASFLRTATYDITTTGCLPNIDIDIGDFYVKAS